jgi:putative ATP-binding cassette transporter
MSRTDWAGFVRLLLAETGPARGPLLASIALAGTASAAIVAILGSLADRWSESGVDWPMLLAFLLASVVALTAQRRALDLATRATEALVRRGRDRVVALVRRADADRFEALGPARLHEKIAIDTSTLSQAGGTVVYGAISALTLGLAALYIATLSLLAFVVVAVLFAVTTSLYRWSQRTSPGRLLAARQAEAAFFETFDHLLSGFKEVKISAARGDDLEVNYLAARSRETERRKVEAMRRLNQGLSLAHTSFYLLLAAVVFVLPRFVDSTPTVMKMTFTVIFMLATIEGVMQALPVLARADAALADLEALEAALAAAGPADEGPATLPDPRMHRIELRGAEYAYLDPAGRPLFTVGPCDLTVEAGETIFLVGGNGSGKSTLLRVLTWLYPPRAGAVLWDGRPVTRANVVDYRNLFGTVLAGFHLFDRLYGAADVDPAQARALLETMGIADKTALGDGAFTNRDLSTGQRKRLAFVAALLEDRPVYILDELAADQDPGFRQRFYEEILPWLKRRGKTLIVVSHDDRYFHVADRVLAMEDGRVVEERRAAR